MLFDNNISPLKKNKATTIVKKKKNHFNISKNVFMCWMHKAKNFYFNLSIIFSIKSISSSVSHSSS